MESAKIHRAFNSLIKDKMIKYLYTIFVLTAFISLTVLTGCPGPEPTPDPVPVPDPAVEQLKTLKNGGTSWVLSSSGVVKDGYDVTDQFVGFKLTIGEYTYSAQNSLSSAWPTSGAWAFNNGNINSIKRDDGVVISVSISGNTMRLSFTVAGSSGGRIAGLSGDYIFNLVSE